jgi:hypothetical protein
MQNTEVELLMVGQRFYIGDESMFQGVIVRSLGKGFVDSGIVDLSLLVWMSGRRWAIEQSFEESKSDVGMDDDEIHTYEGWYHSR